VTTPRDRFTSLNLKSYNAKRQAALIAAAVATAIYVEVRPDSAWPLLAAATVCSVLWQMTTPPPEPGSH
jgi:hypothetical protein